MKNAVNSVENLIRVNTEPSLVGNYLEGVTTRVEPVAKAMAITTHSIKSNLIEKRSAPDNKGDDIVWSTRKRAELGRNDLATFGEFNFNMAGTAIGNQIIEMVGRFPITIERNIRADVVNIKALAKLGLSESAKLASMVIPLASFCRLLTPVLAFISLNIAFVAPMVRTTSHSSSTPNPTLKRTILPVSFGSLMSKGFITVRTHLGNQSLISGIILARVNLTAKLQKTFPAASLLSQRMFRDHLIADNTRLGLDSTNTPALPRAKSGIPVRYFLAANNTFNHNNIITLLDSIVN
jgi:hypothetical protein